MRKIVNGLVVALALVALGASGVAAQARFGLRGGFGLKPDQFVIGGQAEVGNLSFARIVPSVDVGFGDDVTTIAFNGDFLLRVNIPDASIELYGGGGPTVLYADKSNASSDWNLGLTLVVGGRLPVGGKHAVNLEGRIGIGDVPDFRLIAAIIF
jgi:hypothetical protein